MITVRIEISGIHFILGKLSSIKREITDIESLIFELEGVQRGTSDDSTPIEDLNLDVRVYNALKRDSIHTVGDLQVKIATGSIGLIRGLGTVGKRHVLKKLGEYTQAQTKG